MILKFTLPTETGYILSEKAKEQIVKTAPKAPILYDGKPIGHVENINQDLTADLYFFSDVQINLSDVELNGDVVENAIFSSISLI